MTRFRWLLTASLACATGLSASDVWAAPSDDEEEDRGPWGRGTVMPSLGFGASFSSDIHVLSFGLGASYFVWDGLAVGLDVYDTVYIYRDDFKRAFPGIDKTSPTNEVLLLPTLQYVFLRRMRFSPYVTAGVGPVFYNHHRGTIGQWLVGTGAYFKLWGPVALVVGIDFMANFPDSKWKNAFSWDPPPDPVTGDDPAPGSIRGCALVDNPCSFNISPNIGIAFVLGMQPKRAKKRQPPPPAPVNPMPEEQLEPEPAEPEPPEPVEDAPPVDETAPPEDAPPEDTPAPPEDAPPIEPPPDEGPPPPPEEGVPPT